MKKYTEDKLCLNVVFICTNTSVRSRTGIRNLLHVVGTVLGRCPKLANIVPVTYEVSKCEPYSSILFYFQQIL